MFKLNHLNTVQEILNRNNSNGCELINQLVVKSSHSVRAENEDGYTGKSSQMIKHSNEKYSSNLLNNVFKHCEAFRLLGFKARKTQLSHDEGFALFSIVKEFAGGLDRFIGASKGWGESESDIKQLDSFDKKGYAPCSCKRAQNLGICSKNDPEACLKSVDGKSPSPIRFATRPINTAEHLQKIIKKYGVVNE